MEAKNEITAVEDLPLALTVEQLAKVLRIGARQRISTGTAGGHTNGQDRTANKSAESRTVAVSGAYGIIFCKLPASALSCWCMKQAAPSHVERSRT